MKKQSSPPPSPSNRPAARPAQQAWTGRSHIKALVIALAVWIGLFLIVLLEHGRSWAKLLPLLFVIIVLYGVYATWALIRERSRNNNQRYK